MYRGLLSGRERIGREMHQLIPRHPHLLQQLDHLTLNPSFRQLVGLCSRCTYPPNVRCSGSVTYARRFFGAAAPRCRDDPRGRPQPVLRFLDEHERLCQRTEARAADVQAKARAAKTWAYTVNNSGKIAAKWRSVLLAEDDVHDAGLDWEQMKAYGPR